MTYFTTWEEFTKAAERLYTADPMKCRFVIKYGHSKGYLTVKMTDDKVVGKQRKMMLILSCPDGIKCRWNAQCLQYRTEHTQDVKKVEKFTGQLMRHMASKDPIHAK